MRRQALAEVRKERELKELIDEFVQVDQVYKEVMEARERLRKEILARVDGEGEYSGYRGRILVEKVEQIEYDAKKIFNLLGEQSFLCFKVENTKLKALFGDLRKLDECMKGVKEVVRIKVL